MRNTTFIKLKYIFTQLCYRREHGHGIHSPFLYRFISMVLNNPYVFYDFAKIDAELNEIVQDKSSIEINKTLYRIANDSQPSSFLEINSDESLSAIWLTKANTRAKCTCLFKKIEGENNTFHILKKHSEIQSVETTSEFNFIKFIQAQKSLDFVLINPNEKLSDLIDSFEILLQKTHENSIFVVKKNSNMSSKFWRICRKHPKVIVSVEMQNMGILLFRSDLPKQNLKIRIKKPSYEYIH